MKKKKESNEVGIVENKEPKGPFLRSDFKYRDLVNIYYL